MKKLLSIMAVVGLTATASTAVVSCGTKDSNNSNESEAGVTTLEANASIYTAALNSYATKITISKELVNEIEESEDDIELVFSSSKDSYVPIEGLEYIDIDYEPVDFMMADNDKLEFILTIQVDERQNLSEPKTFEGYAGISFGSEYTKNISKDFEKIGHYKFEVLPNLEAEIKYEKSLIKWANEEIRKMNDSDEKTHLNETVKLIGRIISAQYDSYEELLHEYNNNNVDFGSLYELLIPNYD